MSTRNFWLSHLPGSGALEVSGQKAREVKHQQKCAAPNANSIPTQNNLEDHFLATARLTLLDVILLVTTNGPIQTLPEQNSPLPTPSVSWGWGVGGNHTYVTFPCD